MSKTKIVIAEDEGIVALSLQNQLKKLGYEVPTIAYSGQEAIAQVGQIRPHLVLMDIMLEGDMDGIETAAQLRQHFDIPIVYLTANSDYNTLQRAKKTFPSGYLLKPFDEQDLYATIEMALAKFHLEKQLKANEQWLATTLSSIGDAVITTDRDGCITFINPVAEDLTGWSMVEAMGKALSDIFNVINEETLDIVDNLIDEVLMCGVAVGRHNFYVLEAQDGTKTSINYKATPIKDDKADINGIVLTFQDITEQKFAEEKLEHYRDHLEELVATRTAELAQSNQQLQEEIDTRKRIEEQLQYNMYYNVLTGLPNRILFVDHLKRAIGRAERSEDYLFVVLFLGLDKFKLINESMGHTVGDQVLFAVARKLEKSIRPGDTLAYLGGDEFGILVDDIKTIDEALSVVQNIQKQVAVPFQLQEQALVTTTSIGIVLSRDNILGSGYEQAEDILRDADIAKNQAKLQGSNQSVVFDISMRTRAVARLELETELRQAIKLRQLQVFYQPIVSIASGHISRVEALLRWQHSQYGFIAPSEFVPLLEETGLIIPAGEWMLKTVCTQIKAWHTAGYSWLQGAVNLSIRQLREENLPNTIEAIITRTGLTPDAIEIEVTESIAMQNAEYSLVALQKLKELGLHISIDDFGAGYSSLNRLSRMPVNTLKIDRSFVKNIITDANDAAIVRAIIALAHSLNLKVMAEGIETVEQLMFLKKQGCDEAQGFLISEAVSADKIDKLLKRGRLLP